jgi:hypothetical protein
VAVYTFGLANSLSLKYRLEREFADLDGDAREAMRNHRTGGILAVCIVSETFDPQFALMVEGHRPVSNRGPSALTFEGLWIEPRVYAQPAHAIWAYNDRRRRTGAIEPRGPSQYSFNNHIFFFGVWGWVYGTDSVARPPTR